MIHNKFLQNPDSPETPLFNRIIVQDSTIIRLPKRLFEEYSGVANGHSKVCNSRVQGVYDLVAEKFLFFSVDSYSKNDLEAAPELVLGKGDLTLRDRGYLIADEIQRLRNQLQGIGFALDRLDLACSAAELNANPFTGPIEGCIDGLTLNGEGLQINGWGLAWRDSALRGLRVLVNQQEIPLRRFEALPRPDVQTHYAKAPLNSGFNALCMIEHLPPTIHTVTIHGLAEEGFSEPLEFGKYVDIPGPGVPGVVHST